MTNTLNTVDRPQTTQFLPIHPLLRAFDSLPDSAFVPLPVLCALYSCSPATVWRRVLTGDLAVPYKIGARSTRWRVGDIRATLTAAKARGE